MRPAFGSGALKITRVKRPKLMYGIDERVKTMTNISATHLQQQQCPHCRALIEVGTEDKICDSGAILICPECTSFNIIGDDLILREATKQDFDTLSHKDRNRFNSLRLKRVVELAKAQLKNT
jgi:hypothetical protein